VLFHNLEATFRSLLTLADGSVGTHPGKPPPTVVQQEVERCGKLGKLLVLRLKLDQVFHGQGGFQSETLFPELGKEVSENLFLVTEFPGGGCTHLQECHELRFVGLPGQRNISGQHHLCRGP